MDTDVAVEVAAEVSTQSSVAQGAVGASVAVGAATSVLSGTSPQGMWSSVNQFQLYMLVPLVGTFVHKNVLDFLAGFEFSSLSFKFINLPNLPGFRIIFKPFEITEYNEELNSAGLEYKSTIMNLVNLFLILFMMILFHLCVVFPLKRASK